MTCLSYILRYRRITNCFIQQRHVLRVHGILSFRLLHNPKRMITILIHYFGLILLIAFPLSL